jgi:glutathione S-transferase
MDDDWDKVKDRYVGEKFKYLLSRISGMIKTNKGNMRLLCGQQLTWVDLAVADLVNVMTILDTRAKDYSSQLQAFTNGIFQIYQL